MSEVPRDRPWQIMLTGPGLGAIDAATRQALEQILELFTEVGGLVVQTTAGDVSVTRDFPSDYTIDVDRLLGEIFTNSPAVIGIKCLGSENAHRATPEDPYWSAHGKTYAGIKEAAARGELTPEAPIVAYRASLYPKSDQLPGRGIMTKLRTPLDTRALDRLMLGSDAAVAACQEQRLKLEAARKARHNPQAADLAQPQSGSDDEVAYADCDAAQKTLNVRKGCVVGDKLIRFPVHCPKCGKEWTSALNRDELTDAFRSGSAIRVYAECHDAAWDLTQVERDDLCALVDK